MTAPTVSVLIPCFNAGRFVGSTLESVLAQTWQPTEIIVVNDGSTDDSADVLARYQHHGVTVIHKANAGAAAARNQAFRRSHGSHVLWLDADDWIGPDHIAKLVARAAERKDAIAFSRWGRFAGDPSLTKPESRPSQGDLRGVEWLVREWQDGMPMMQSGMYLIPRELISARGGWNERLGLIDDLEFFARLISASPALLYAPEALLCYRSGVAGSLSSQVTRKAAESCSLSLLLGTEHLLAAEDSLRTRRVCARILQNFEFEFYPDHPDLRRRVRQRVEELGGCDAAPMGPPGFHALRRWIGWKAARRVQRLATHLGLNSAARAQVP